MISPDSHIIFSSLFAIVDIWTIVIYVKSLSEGRFYLASRIITGDIIDREENPIWYKTLVVIFFLSIFSSLAITLGYIFQLFGRTFLLYTVVEKYPWLYLGKYFEVPLFAGAIRRKLRPNSF